MRKNKQIPEKRRSLYIKLTKDKPKYGLKLSRQYFSELQLHKLFSLVH